MEGFGATESYLRVQVREGFDPLEVQGDLAAVPGYIGSFVVETESVGGGPFFPFDIAVGFNGDEEAVELASRRRPGASGRGRGARDPEPGVGPGAGRAPGSGRRGSAVGQAQGLAVGFRLGRSTWPERSGPS